MMKIFIILLCMYSVLYATSYQQIDRSVVELKAKDRNHKNLKTKHVIQGLAFYKNDTFITQTIKDKKLLINKLDDKGDSLAAIEIAYPSHGADLSIGIVKKNIITFFTSGKKNRGILKIEAILNPFRFKSKKYIKLQHNGSVIALSENRHYFLVKSRDRIFIYTYKDIIKNVEHKEIYSFLLSDKQRRKGQWSQGMVMKNGIIYCLTGDNTLNGKKFLVLYDSYGRILQEYDLSTGKVFSSSIGTRWELEGLAFKKNKLFTTVMGTKKVHRMMLYEILNILKKDEYKDFK